MMTEEKIDVLELSQSVSKVGNIIFEIRGTIISRNMNKWLKAVLKDLEESCAELKEQIR